jgi:hypothetical protein
MNEKGNSMAPLDPNLRAAVVRALEDSRYEWRTVDGLAEETGLSAANLQEILKDLNGEIIRSSTPDESGRALYTTRKHYRETQGLGTRILSALSDKVA